MPKKKQSEKKETKGKGDTKKKELRPWDILVYPHLTEKSMNMVEMENKLVFIVDRKATKRQVKEAIEKEFEVKVEWVKSEVNRKGYKKAYVKINPEFSASDVASKLGMI